MKIPKWVWYTLFGALVLGLYLAVWLKSVGKPTGELHVGGEAPPQSAPAENKPKTAPATSEP